MTSVQPFTQPQFEIKFSVDIVDREIKKKGILKWEEISLKASLIQQSNKNMVLLDVFKMLDNKENGMNEKEFAIWWNDNKDSLND